jgi:hypothetical protein
VLIKRSKQRNPLLATATIHLLIFVLAAGRASRSWVNEVGGREKRVNRVSGGVDGEKGVENEVQNEVGIGPWLKKGRSGWENYGARTGKEPYTPGVGAQAGPDKERQLSGQWKISGRTA